MVKTSGEFTSLWAPILTTHARWIVIERGSERIIAADLDEQTARTIAAVPEIALSMVKLMEPQGGPAPNYP